MSKLFAGGAAVLGKELAEPLLPMDSWLDVLSAERVISPSKFNVRLAAGKLRLLVPSWVGTVKSPNFVTLLGQNNFFLQKSLR
jgi:hypothetical protein